MKTMSDIFTASNGMKIAWRDYKGFRVLCRNARGATGLILGREDKWSPIGSAFGSEELTGFTEQSDMHDALSEFYLHEQGFWRDYITGYLVTRESDSDDDDGRAIRVIDDKDSFLYRERIVRCAEDTKHRCAAERYFAANPNPKTWLKAEPGEVWVLETRGVDDRWNPAAFRVEEVEGQIRFYATEPNYSVEYLGLNATAIESGNRIWPEASDA